MGYHRSRKTCEVALMARTTKRGERMVRGSVDRDIDRAMRNRDRGREAPDRSLRGESVLGRLKAGASTVAAKVGPIAEKVQAHAQKVNANMEMGEAPRGRGSRRSSGGVGGGGMGMDFGFTPFGGGLPSAPGFGGGFGPAPRERAPRKGGGSKTTIRTGGKTITISSGGGKKKKKKGGGGGGLPPWHPDFRLPY